MSGGGSMTGRWSALVYDSLLDKWATRDSIAQEYAAVIRYEPDADWPALNAAILQRYSVSGLEYIKRKAWEANLAAAVARAGTEER